MLNAKASAPVRLEEQSASLTLVDLAKIVISAVIIALAVNVFLRPTFVSGKSMWPTLNNGDLVFTSTMAYRTHMPETGDIIVLHSDLPEDIIIKRVIASEGDALKISVDGIYVNGVLLEEDYINTEEPASVVGNRELVIPEGKVFVMGDNRNHSMDSRFKQVGLIDKSQIIGKAIFRAFPFSKIGTI